MTPHVFFDLDGTLVDSAPGLLASIQSALHELELEEPGEEVLRSLLGKPVQEIFALIEVPDDVAPDALVRFRRAYTADGIYNASVFPGIVEVLQSLRESGRTLTVATSKPVDFATTVLSHLGLDHHFSFVAGATLDGSRRAKADVIAHALHHVGVAPHEVTMVGDKQEDVLGAAAHGMNAIAVAWGYGEPHEFEYPNVLGVALTSTQLEALLTQE